jgi:hypothetical protein
MDREINLINEIARMAYSIYEKRGHVPGHDFADWIEAEKIVMNKYLQGKTDTKKAVSSTKHVKTSKKKIPKISRPTL